MPSASQLLALLKSHLQGDEQRFYSVAIQVAAQEAKKGHHQLADEIRSLIDNAKSRRGMVVGTSPGAAIPISRARGDLGGLLAVSYPSVRLSDLVLGEGLREQLGRVIREQRHSVELLEHGLAPRRKLLLVGPPGTGKTLTASVLAGELGLPLLQVRLDGLLTRFMGEAAAKLRQIFEATAHTRGVYFFDEFDAIGTQRTARNDVGEIRRVLNSFLQMLEQDQSHSLVLAATNHVEVLDRALFRRFDDVLVYALPDLKQIEIQMRRRLGNLASTRTPWRKLARAACGLSFADVVRVLDDVQKEYVIAHEKRVTGEMIGRMIEERKLISNRPPNTP